MPTAHVPACNVAGGVISPNSVPYSLQSGVQDQGSCHSLCVGGYDCLSYSIASGTCVIYGTYVSQRQDPTGFGTIGWDVSCPVLPNYCGFLGDLPVAPAPLPCKRTIPPTKTPNESGTPAPFAEYYWQLCIADSLCVSYTFDPVNLLCDFYSQTVAAITPIADPAGIQFYDISCAPPIYPDPACNVYALTNSATNAAFVTTISPVTTINECLGNYLYNCLAVSYSVD
ncbi:uncharacterized protein PAC_13617 [Phialocephala subalpina]|uniref:Uncharacterized protein n=1 Tax=Phialocephala subalpina TaxID=576137 RepID=A0A1L7XF98_9HELO|nr:uncharacterized protein PAC_13617 [Phialocephala subalpina]